MKLHPAQIIFFAALICACNPLMQNVEFDCSMSTAKERKECMINCDKDSELTPDGCDKKCKALICIPIGENWKK